MGISLATLTCYSIISVSVCDCVNGVSPADKSRWFVQQFSCVSSGSKVLDSVKLCGGAVLQYTTEVGWNCCDKSFTCEHTTVFSPDSLTCIFSGDWLTIQTQTSSHFFIQFRNQQGGCPFDPHPCFIQCAYKQGLFLLKVCLYVLPPPKTQLS
jgi:hypothetical protein